jgi:hypothetical protein
MANQPPGLDVPQSHVYIFAALIAMRRRSALSFCASVAH